MAIYNQIPGIYFAVSLYGYITTVNELLMSFPEKTLIVFLPYIIIDTMYDCILCNIVYYNSTNLHGTHIWSESRRYLCHWYKLTDILQYM